MSNDIASTGVRIPLFPFSINGESVRLADLKYIFLAIGRSGRYRDWVRRIVLPSVRSNEIMTRYDVRDLPLSILGMDDQDDARNPHESNFLVCVTMLERLTKKHNAYLFCEESGMAPVEPLPEVVAVQRVLLEHHSITVDNMAAFRIADAAIRTVDIDTLADERGFNLSSTALREILDSHNISENVLAGLSKSSLQDLAEELRKAVNACKAAITENARVHRLSVKLIREERDSARSIIENQNITLKEFAVKLQNADLIRNKLRTMLDDTRQQLAIAEEQLAATEEDQILRLRKDFLAEKTANTANADKPFSNNQFVYPKKGIYLTINLQGFSNNYMYEPAVVGHNGEIRMVKTHQYRGWFRAASTALSYADISVIGPEGYEGVDFTKPIGIDMTVCHDSKYDTNNLTKSLIDAIAERFGFNDKLVRRHSILGMDCDAREDQKTIFFISNIE